ncbi:MAG TPA: hypothetical protein VIW23_03070 [Candidatus Acidoferrum sp.]|jgi:hypothetical protein
MKVRALLTSLAVCLVAVGFCLAAEGFIASWKLNEAKSKFPPGAQKNTTVVYEPAGDSVKVTLDGVGADGKPTHSEWTGKFDGKDYPSTGSTTDDARAYTKINDHTLHVVLKKDGKPVATAHIVTSADGKTRTVTVSSTDAKGKKQTSIAVYDKQ